MRGGSSRTTPAYWPFLTGYVVEKSLSVDNIFVFVMVFGYFAVPAQYQHRVLFYGILGALVLRALFIAAGTVLMQFHWVIWVFGGFLILTGIKMLFIKGNGDPSPRSTGRPALRPTDRRPPARRRAEA